MLEELKAGKVFHGRYEIVRCMKAGGMGAVYEVVHLETRRHRALKVMLPSLVRDEAMRNRFRLEAQITADVESDHIVETFDAGVDLETGAPFIVMELLRGEDLAHLLEARRSLPACEVVGLLTQLARALEQTHASGIVHRDLKPENLFLAVRGDDPPRLKVLDFGIAKIVAQSSGESGTTNIGTPLYMSPEQLRGGAVSPRTDLFTVGHIAYALLTGTAYWSEESDREGLLPLLDRVARGPVESASIRAARRGVTLPRAFDVWFLMSTAPRPEDRFERARDQVAELTLALGVEARDIRVPTPRAPLGSNPRRSLVSDMETAPARPSEPVASAIGSPSPPPIASVGFAPTSVSAGLPVETSVSARSLALGGLLAPERDARVASISDASEVGDRASFELGDTVAPRAPGRLTNRIVGAVVAALGAGALVLALTHRASSPVVATTSSPQTTVPAVDAHVGAAGAVTSQELAVVPPIAPGAVDTGASDAVKTTPPPRVDPGGAAPMPAPTSATTSRPSSSPTSLASTTPAPDAHSASRARGFPARVPSTSAPAKRDPSKVFD